MSSFPLHPWHLLIVDVSTYGPLKCIKLFISFGWILYCSCDMMIILLCCCGWLQMLNHWCYLSGRLGMLLFFTFTETPFCHFFGTLRCVRKQSISGAPLVWVYKASSHRGRLVSTLLLLGPISKHLECLFRSYKKYNLVFHVWRPKYQKRC